MVAGGDLLRALRGRAALLYAAWRLRECENARMPTVKFVTSHTGAAQHLRARVTQVLVLDSMHQGAMLVHV